MSLRFLKWVTIAAPLAFLGALAALREALDPALFRGPFGYLLLGGLAILGIACFTQAVFRVVGQVHDRLAQRNRELLALHRAGLAIAGQLHLETVLQEVVDQARDLVRARYGALSQVGEDGGVQSFLTSGLTPEERRRIGALPVGHGLLGVVLREGQRLRIRDIAADPRSAGFPAHHPRMHSLLAVPVLSGHHVLGNLYLTEKEGAPEFTEEDEETLARFATQAAVAIQNAQLHRQVQAVAITQERERIAREMHDTLAQMLGYVNIKAQAAQELLESGKVDVAARQIGELAETAQAAYADVREGILGLRTSPGEDRGFLQALTDYVDQWQELSGVAVELTVACPDGLLHELHPAAEVQLLRIVQEALTNVRKHACATQALIRLAEPDGALEVEVADNGIGFDPSTPGRRGLPRFGLATMRERAEAIGGTLILESEPGRGTRVIARLPTLAPPTKRSEPTDARLDR